MTLHSLHRTGRTRCRPGEAATQCNQFLPPPHTRNFLALLDVSATLADGTSPAACPRGDGSTRHERSFTCFTHFVCSDCCCSCSALTGCDPEDLDPAKKPDDKDKSRGSTTATKEAPSKPSTHKVEKGPFKIDVTLKGVLEAQTMSEIALSLEAWSPNKGGLLVVSKTIEHGARVKKGDPVLWLDLEMIDQTIRDLETDRDLNDLALHLAEMELPVLEKSTPLEMADAERAKKRADEDLKRFLELDRSFAEKAADQIVKSYQNMVDYIKEELRQLEKMYRSKDLTEETEEIILRRQRHTVESAEFSLQEAEMDARNDSRSTLPRQDPEPSSDNAVRQAIDPRTGSAPRLPPR